jgi:hypothetical protein
MISNHVQKNAHDLNHVPEKAHDFSH